MSLGARGDRLKKGDNMKGCSLVIWLILLIQSCGYTIGNTSKVRSVKVPTFENKTLYRMTEFALTDAVARELIAQGISVNSQDATYELLGEVADYKKPSLVADEYDKNLVSSVRIKLNITLKNRKTGKILWTDSRTEEGIIIEGKNRPEECARQEVFAKLAKWVVGKLDEEW